MFHFLNHIVEYCYPFIFVSLYYLISIYIFVPYKKPSRHLQPTRIAKVIFLKHLSDFVTPAAASHA